MEVALEPGAALSQRVLTVRVTIAPGYHLYAEPVPEGFVPLSVHLDPASAVVVGRPEWPVAERLAVEDVPDQFWVYHGQVVGRLPIEPKAAVVEGEVAYQVCTETTCFLPARVAFRLPLERS